MIFASSSRYRALTVFAGVYLLISAALRLGLWWIFGLHGGVPASLLPMIVLSGAVNDAVEAVYLLMPVAIYLWLVTPRFHASRTGSALMFIGGYLVIFGMAYLCGLEYFFFEEFDARFNLVAVDYLIYPTEVIGNIQETYPVGPISAGIALAAALLYWRLWPRLKPAVDPNAPKFAQRTVIFAVHVALVVLLSFLYSTDSSDASGNRLANELGRNGPSSFFQAFHTNNIEYPTYYRTGNEQAMRKLLADDLAHGGGRFTQLDQGKLTRSFEPRPQGYGKLNIVLLSEESLGAEFVGAYGDTRGLTPEFDALTQEGLLFTRAYASGTRTVRGLEAFSASVPPIPSESVVKRPGNDAVQTWGEVLQKQGYHSSFLYGGFGAFDNMNDYFANNGYAISDRADIANPKFANIWGVSDEDLFMHAIAYYDERAKEGKPFYSIVMSTSNHKPFTFPEGIEGVKPEGGGRDAGTRYADYAIGQFFREAKKNAWYDNTVFIVVADHGARVYGSAEIPLFSYEIPLLIIAPGHLKPGRVDVPTGQIDIMPTVLGMLGLGYESSSFGQDILSWPQDQPRTLLFNHNHNVALMQGDELAILGLKSKAQCERYQRGNGPARRDNDHFTQIPPNASLIDLATAYYQTTYNLYTRHQYE